MAFAVSTKETLLLVFDMKGGWKEIYPDMFQLVAAWLAFLVSFYGAIVQVSRLFCGRKQWISWRKAVLFPIRENRARRRRRARGNTESVPRLFSITGSSFSLDSPLCIWQHCPRRLLSAPEDIRDKRQRSVCSSPGWSTHYFLVLVFRAWYGSALGIHRELGLWKYGSWILYLPIIAQKTEWVRVFRLWVAEIEMNGLERTSAVAAGDECWRQVAQHDVVGEQ